MLGKKLAMQEEAEPLDLEKSIRSVLFAKQQFEINQIVEMLMQVDQNGSLTPQNDSASISKKEQSYQQRLLSLGGFN